MGLRDKPEVNDLINDSDFRKWVYFGEDNAIWENWLQQNSERVHVVETARNILLTIKGEEQPLSQTEVREAVHDIVSNLTPAIDSGHKAISYRFRAAKWAAAILLFLSAGFLAQKSYFNRSLNLSVKQVDESESSLIHVVNKEEPPKLVHLPDGSSVLLMQGADISYPKRFSEDFRNVSLSGEAFFEIYKNPDHPFIVYAGNLVAKVVGTSFTIKANGQKAEIRVKTGKVLVSSLNAGQEFLLLPKQQAILSDSDSRIVLLEDSKRELASIETQVFEFKRTPLSEVFSSFEKAYNIRFEYDMKKTEGCTVTASLGDDPLTEKLNMLCEVLGASYSISGNVISVKVSGCQ